MIELLLSDCSPTRWLGAVRINDDLFKVVIWPGDLNKPWSATLMPTAFTQVTEESKLYQAITHAYTDRQTKDLFTIIAANPELFAELLKEAPNVLDQSSNTSAPVDPDPTI